MIAITRAKTADAALIADIGRKTFLETHAKSASVQDLETYAGKHLSVEAFRTELEDENQFFHLISIGKILAGYSKIVPNSAHPLIGSPRVTKLERLYLLEEHRGAGLGLRLFEFNRALSKDLGQSGMWLIVWEGNARAIEFYERAGFSIIGTTLFKISETRSNPNFWMYLEY